MIPNSISASAVGAVDPARLGLLPRAAGSKTDRQRASGSLLHVFPSFNVGGAQVRFASLAEGLGDGFSRHESCRSTETSGQRLC